MILSAGLARPASRPRSLRPVRPLRPEDAHTVRPVVDGLAMPLLWEGDQA